MGTIFGQAVSVISAQSTGQCVCRIGRAQQIAVTLNGAAAIDMADKVGSVEVGKQGDLVIWDAPDLDYICYRVGSNLAKTVIKRGRLM